MSCYNINVHHKAIIRKMALDVADQHISGVRHARDQNFTQMCRDYGLVIRDRYGRESASTYFSNYMRNMPQHVRREYTLVELHKVNEARLARWEECQDWKIPHPDNVVAGEDDGKLVRVPKHRIGAMLEQDKMRMLKAVVGELRHD